MKEQNSIPVGKVARAGRFAGAGVKVGANYVTYEANYLKHGDNCVTYETPHYLTHGVN